MNFVSPQKYSSCLRDGDLNSVFAKRKTRSQILIFIIDKELSSCQCLRKPDELKWNKVSFRRWTDRWISSLLSLFFFFPVKITYETCITFGDENEKVIPFKLWKLGLYYHFWQYCFCGALHTIPATGMKGLMLLLGFASFAYQFEWHSRLVP